MAAYEFSVVAVPAQPSAGVLKRRQGSGVRRQEAAYLEELERLAQDGRMYRTELLEKTMRAGSAALPEMKRELLRAMCGGLPTEQLRELHETLRAKAAERLPVCAQLYQGAGGRKQGAGDAADAAAGYRV